jgi:hypothetical protein
MREHLLGYVLGALDAAEQSELEARRDLQLRGDLNRSHTRRLDDDDTDSPLLPGMAATCRYPAPAGWKPWAEGRSETLHASGSWRAQDVTVAAGVFVAASLLIFPAISSSVSGSRRMQCQNNFRAIAMGLGQYSEQYGGYFPYVPAEGKFGVAGIYAPLLTWGGYLQKPCQILCPESATEDQRNYKIPAKDEIERASRLQLKIIHVYIGGSYCYSPGYIDRNGVYRGTRNRGRTYFAILADKPGNLAGGVPATTRAANALFENGRVEFQIGPRVYEVGDDIYTSDYGLRGAGRGEDDAVACPSETPPVLMHPMHLQFR